MATIYDIAKLSLIVRHEGADTALSIPPRQMFRQSMLEGRHL